MFLIKVGDSEDISSNPLELKSQMRDFDQAKQKAVKLLKTFTLIKIIDSETNSCVHFLTRDGR
jgi:hypothetical protein